jgi:hypothetical protein
MCSHRRVHPRSGDYRKYEVLAAWARNLSPKTVQANLFFPARMHHLDGPVLRFGDLVRPRISSVAEAQAWRGINPAVQMLATSQADVASSNSAAGLD